MSPEFVQVATAFWVGFASGVLAAKFGWPRLQAKLADVRAKIREKL